MRCRIRSDGLAHVSSAVSPDPNAEGGRRDFGDAPIAHGPLHTLCSVLSRVCLGFAVLGLIGVILAVQWQVFGRYVLNDTPTWAEALALQLVLYVTAFGVAVGVRDAAHIGLESLLALLPSSPQRWAEIGVHAMVALFGTIMVKAGWTWTALKWSDPKPLLGVPVGVDYLALVICGSLVLLFSIEHIVARLRGQRVEPAWN
jgi:TRAP-type transport system small permease protein